MTNTIVSRAMAGMAVAAFAFALFLAVPKAAHAGFYDCNGSCFTGSGYRVYPPAPTFYNTPSVQVTYSNGYYQNYFVPTVRYFPAPYPTPVTTVYYPPYFQSPVPTYHRHW